MRLSYSVREQIRVLALVQSVGGQFDVLGADLPGGLAAALGDLRHWHDCLKRLVLDDAGVPVEDGRMQLPEKVFRAWLREEDEMKSRVLAVLPEGDLDARALLNCVLAAVEDQAAGMPEKPMWRSAGWGMVELFMRRVYREYDPDLEAVEAMRVGVEWAEGIRG